MRKILLVCGMAVLCYSISLAQNTKELQKRSSFEKKKDHFEFAEESFYPISNFPTKNQSVKSEDYGDAPEWKWASKFGGNGEDYCIGMVADSIGNLYTYGYASGEIDFFGESINSGLFLSKQNYLGEVLWIKDFDDLRLEAGYGNYIVLDPKEENIFITGELTDTFEIVGEESLTPTRDNGYYIVKYSTDGDFQWAIQEDIECSALCLTADYSGNLLISGTFCCDTDTIGNTEIISEGGSDVFIAKYDANGDFIWAKRAGGEITEYWGLISVDGDDNIYFTGEFISENITISNADTTMNDGDGNIVFAKLNPDGNVQWIKLLGSSTIEFGDNSSWPSGIITDEQGQTYIKGWHGDSTSFGDTMLLSPYGYGYSYFISKFDSDGNVLWANSIQKYKLGFDYNLMDIDENGNVYLGAQAMDTLFFGDDYSYINSPDTKDLFMAKYSTNGELVYVKPIPSTDGWLSSVAVWDTNFVFVGGYFDSDITFGDQEITSTNQNGFLALVGNDVSSPEILTCASDSTIILSESNELLVPDLSAEVESKDNYSTADSLIITQNPESGTYLSSGEGDTHEVIITVEDEEGNAETCTVILTGASQTNIDYLKGSDQEMLIYPNPSTDVINILFETQNEPIEFKLYDMYGRLVLTKVTDESNQITISKSEVNGSGIYIIKINNNQDSNGKVIFQ